MTERIVSRPYACTEFRAMASPCRIVSDDSDLVAAGIDLVRELESRWSRFLPDSEISGVNGSGGALCVVSPSTYRLLQLSQRARVLTAGRFNPLMSSRMDELGYSDRETSSAGGGAGRGDIGEWSACDDDIELFDDLRAVRLPGGVRFDPGGIGKGLAGDFVVERLTELGASTVQVELGGDVRLSGENWTGGQWSIGVQDPRDRSRQVASVSIAEGAVATSSVLSNTWTRAGKPMHHLIDPDVGLPCVTDLASVTVTASELWWAEIVAKVALMAGSTQSGQVIAGYGLSGLSVDGEGTVRSTEHVNGVA
jgi:FAD:protein FMN transferase